MYLCAPTGQAGPVRAPAQRCQEQQALIVMAVELAQGIASL